MKSLYLLVCLFLPVAANAAEIHVRPDGPIRTLADAQREARKNKATVVVHAGTYYLPETLVLTAADSGTKYVAAPGEKPVLSGGMKLDLQWQPYKGGIMRARNARDTGDRSAFRQRSAADDGPLSQLRPDMSPSTTATRPMRSAPRGSSAGPIRRADSSTLCTRGDGAASTSSSPAKITAGNLTYEGGWQINRGNKMHEEYRFVENIFEELDAPGEWFFDRKAGMLYYYPPKGVDLNRALVESAGSNNWSCFADRRKNRSGSSHCRDCRSAMPPGRSWKRRCPCCEAIGPSPAWASCSSMEPRIA